MKTKQTILFLYTFFALLTTGQNAFSQDQKKGKETVKLLVEEMECKNCQAKIEKNIAFEKGVTDLKCDLKTRTVDVTYKTDKTTPEKIVEGFAKIGYAVQIMKAKGVDSQDKKE